MRHYLDLDNALDRLIRRRPPWIDTLATIRPIDGRPSAEALTTVIRTINADPGNTPASDRIIRQLIELGREESDAITLIARALAPRLRAKIGNGGSEEFHADAMSTLVIACMGDEITGERLALKLINRAHNHTWRHSVRTRRRGIHGQFEIRPLDPERVADIADHLGINAADPADHVARAVDLSRFAGAVRAAIEADEISEATWTRYVDYRLARALDRPGGLSSVARSQASRCGTRLLPWIEQFLESHAA